MGVSGEPPHSSICLFGDGERTIEISADPEGGLHANFRHGTGKLVSGLGISSDDRVGLCLYDHRTGTRTELGSDSNESPIALSEWRSAVEATEGVRLFAAAAHTFTNPKTGEVISIGAREGDTDVFFPDTGEWRSVFRWRGDSAAVAARFDPTDTSHPVWRAAVALAARLGAAIRGDEGELYDFETGEVTDA